MEVGAMPKEYIKHPNHPEFRLELVWDRDKFVQLGAVNTDEQRDEPGAAGFFVDLDRDGCNRLIRAVRRARDAAFGADA